VKILAPSPSLIRVRSTPDGVLATISLNELLPQVLLPQDDLDPRYDHTLHLFVRELLTRLGPTGRRLPQVVKVCGRALAKLFPYEDDDPEGSLGEVSPM
jgi:hypothetical protein